MISSLFPPLPANLLLPPRGSPCLCRPTQEAQRAELRARHPNRCQASLKSTGQEPVAQVTRLPARAAPPALGGGSDRAHRCTNSYCLCMTEQGAERQVGWSTRVVCPPLRTRLTQGGVGTVFSGSLFIPSTMLLLMARPLSPQEQLAQQPSEAPEWGTGNCAPPRVPPVAMH